MSIKRRIKMSREIKFRAWDSAYKKMFNSENSNAYKITFFGSVIEGDVYANEIILMQYTGLKDKNGKEIYEGDILKMVDPNYMDCEDNDFNIIVVEYNEFSNCGCCEWISGIGFNLNNEFNYESIEILGNIYENRELLEKINA
jgi:uncharacterized phage protein (TIGR01671 family)